jgi:hypothetical protein
MTKRNLLKFHCFGHWNISVLVIVSDFEIRISNFLPKNRGFRSDTNYAKAINGDELEDVSIPSNRGNHSNTQDRCARQQMAVQSRLNPLESGQSFERKFPYPKTREWAISSRN